MAETKNAGGAGEAAPAATTTNVPNISQARLNTIIAGLWICLFVSAMDTTIVTTALVKISSGFDSLEMATWIVTAYLLTYNSFLMITAKLSDIWGLKTLLIGCAMFFLVFSMACGGAQTMVQLIVFRSLQGIGGSGLYSLTFVAIMQMIVPEKIGFYSGIISSVFAMSNLLGPLFGGIIVDHTTWRWIFFLNGPTICFAMVILFFSMPTRKDGRTNMQRVREFDGIGGLLSIGWPIPLIFALQEAGVSHPWSSGVIIGTLTAGIVVLIIFVLYETWVTYRTKTEPIFPIRFLRSPSMALVLLSMFLAGFPFYVIFVQLPQRFQTVNFTTAQRAGILLLPAAMMTPVGAMVAGLAVKKKVPVEFVLITALTVVCIGTGLLSSLPTYSHTWPGLYGYEIITGIGLGLASPPYYMLVASSVAEKDRAVGTGALNMARTLGGCVSVAICSAVHREFIDKRLREFLSPAQIHAVERSSGAESQFPPAIRDRIGAVFGSSYNRQFQVMLAFTGLNIIVAIILAVVRKRLGTFGVIPENKEANEFRVAAEEKSTDEEAHVDYKNKPIDTAAVRSIDNQDDPDITSPTDPEAEKKLA